LNPRPLCPERAHVPATRQHACHEVPRGALYHRCCGPHVGKMWEGRSGIESRVARPDVAPARRQAESVSNMPRGERSPPLRLQPDRLASAVLWVANRFCPPVASSTLPTHDHLLTQRARSGRHDSLTGASPIGTLGRGAHRVGRAFWDILTALVTHPYPSFWSQVAWSFSDTASAGPARPSSVVYERDSALNGERAARGGSRSTRGSGREGAGRAAASPGGSCQQVHRRRSRTR
jgi:hypothetical protein